MLSIICLGHKACEIGEIFEKSKDYIVKLIDKDIEGENCFSLKAQKTAEDYEKHTPDLQKFFSDISDNVLFITSGDTEVLSSSLSILKQIKNKNISILYIKPIKDFLSTNISLQDRMAFNVFQEYARSGVFNRIFLFDDSMIDVTISDAAISEYDIKYYGLIYNSILNFINLTNVEAMIDNTLNIPEISRITGFGYYDIETDFENMLYDIKNPDIKTYNFYINKDSLNNDKTLHKKIREKIKNKNTNITKCSYSIRQIDTEQSFCFVIASTKYIQ